jgi:hypothetical protein
MEKQSRLPIANARAFPPTARAWIDSLMQMIVPAADFGAVIGASKPRGAPSGARSENPFWLN